MRTYKLILIIFCIATLPAVVACNKKKTGTTIGTDTIVATGTLEQIGATTFMYGTHKLRQSTTMAYVLKSTTIDLSKYEGAQVQITAVNTHYHAEQGPEMYDVIAIKRAP